MKHVVTTIVPDCPMCGKEMHVVGRMAGVDDKGNRVGYRLRQHWECPGCGHVYLPDSEIHPWVAEYVNQWTVFPNGKHDDMVDASTQALSRLFLCTGEVWTDEEVRSLRGQRNCDDDLVGMYEAYSDRRDNI